MKRMFSFDDVSFGLADEGNQKIVLPLAKRRVSIPLQDWYTFAAELSKSLNALEFHRSSPVNDKFEQLLRRAEYLYTNYKLLAGGGGLDAGAWINDVRAALGLKDQSNASPLMTLIKRVEALEDFGRDSMLMEQRVEKLEADAERFRSIEARINTWIQACAEAGALRNYGGSDNAG